MKPSVGMAPPLRPQSGPSSRGQAGGSEPAEHAQGFGLHFPAAASPPPGVESGRSNSEPWLAPSRRTLVLASLPPAAASEPEPAAGKVSSAIDPVRVTVVRFESHLAPSAEVAWVRALADPIAREFAGMRQADQPPAQGVTKARGMPTVVRTLDIELRPADLGTLEVRLRMQGPRLEVTVTASERSTAEWLRGQADGLARALGSAGYALDTAEIVILVRDAPGAGVAGMASAAGETGRPGVRASAAADPEQRIRTRKGDADDAPDSDGVRARDGVYL